MTTSPEKQSAAAILGYRVIRATPKQVEDGRCLSWIRQAFGTGGTSRMIPITAQKRGTDDNR